MLTVQRRHSAPCKKPQWDKYMKCACTLHIMGTLGGKQIALAVTKYLPPERRTLDEARSLAILWERAGSPVKPEEFAAPLPAAEPDTARPSVEMAVAAFIQWGIDRGNGEATQYKRRHEFQTSLLGFCREKGIRFLSELDIAALSEWRSTWNVGSVAREKRQGRVIGFMWFCERRGWLPRNYATDITHGLGKIQVKATQTGYFQPAEYAAVIEATRQYNDRGGRTGESGIGGERIRAVTELMRWTGLRIRDAVTLEKHRLSHDASGGMWSVMVYQRKTGDPVYCPIPPHVAWLLQHVPASQKGNTNERYFFWTGAGLPKTLVANWQRSYSKLFKLVGIKEPDGSPKRCHPHMFRDTFAVESLLSGMRLEEVSTILGHSSVKVTEKHYMPWVRARQSSLNQSVMNSWIKQGIVKPPAGAGRPRKLAQVVPLPVAVGE
jgi:integrase/recombinase XerD